MLEIFQFSYIVASEMTKNKTKESSVTLNSFFFYFAIEYQVQTHAELLDTARTNTYIKNKKIAITKYYNMQSCTYTI